MRELVIGVDLGTSSCKATAFDMQGRAVARARRPYSTQLSADGGATQRPADWDTAALDALAELSAALQHDHVLGIGVSGQIGTHVLIDAAGTPLHDAVTWQDARPAGMSDEPWSQLDRGATASALRTWLPSGGAWPLVRLLWMTEQLPRELAAAEHLAQPKDLLLLRLTGRLVSDPSSWRGLARPDGTVLESALVALGLPSIVPDLVDGMSLAGTLLTTVAARIGLPESTPVFVGWNDLNASLIGVGATVIGDAFDVGGTSEHIGVLTHVPAAGFGAVSIPHHGVSTEHYTVYGVSSNGGSALQWLNDLGAPGSLDIEDALRRSSAGASGLLFLPYLYGERAPIWDAAASGGFIGLRAVHGMPELARSVLEGVALNLRQIFGTLPKTGADRPIRATGGTSASPGWNQIKANVLARPLVTTEESDTSSLGAAMTAAIGAAVFADVHEAAAAMVHESGVFEPEPTTAAVYDEHFADFVTLYPALADVSHRLRKRTR